MAHYNFIQKSYDHTLKKWDISITPYKRKSEAMAELEKHATILLNKKERRGIDGAGVIYSVIRQLN